MYSPKRLFPVSALAIGSLFLTSCLAPQEAVGSINSSESTSVKYSVSEETDPSTTSASDESEPEPDSKAEPEISERTQPVDPKEKTMPASGITEEARSPEKTIIAVQPVSAYGGHELFYITDSSTQNQILDLLSARRSAGLINPTTSSYLFELSITQNGVTEDYTLLSDTDSDGNSYILS